MCDYNHLDLKKRFYIAKNSNPVYTIQDKTEPFEALQKHNDYMFISNVMFIATVVRPR